MKPMQEKVLDRLEGRICMLDSSCKLEVVTSFSYANSGRLIVQPENSLETICCILFGFQQDYVQFTFQPADAEKPGLHKDWNFHLRYSLMHSLDEGLTNLVGLVWEAVQKWEEDQ